MDVTRAQALALIAVLYAAPTVSYRSIDPNAPTMAGKPKKRRLHIEKRGNPALLHPSVHSRSQFR